MLRKRRGVWRRGAGNVFRGNARIKITARFSRHLEGATWRVSRKRCARASNAQRYKQASKFVAFSWSAQEEMRAQTSRALAHARDNAHRVKRLAKRRGSSR